MYQETNKKVYQQAKKAGTLEQLGEDLMNRYLSMMQANKAHYLKMHPMGYEDNYELKIALENQAYQSAQEITLSTMFG